MNKREFRLEWNVKDDGEYELIARIGKDSEPRCIVTGDSTKDESMGQILRNAGDLLDDFMTEENFNSEYDTLIVNLTNKWEI